MLTQELRNKLIETIKRDPKEAIKIIENEPGILTLLLRSNEETEQERNEKIKYINMSLQMERQLQEEARKLNTTQGLLIGAGILLLISLLDKK